MKKINNQKREHTHTHPFNGPFSGTTQVSRHQKGKTNLDFTEARDSEWQWLQLGHVQVCTSLQTDNHANTHHSVFLQAGCPSCRPTNSVKALKAKPNERTTCDKFLFVFMNHQFNVYFYNSAKIVLLFLLPSENSVHSFCVDKCLILMALLSLVMSIWTASSCLLLSCRPYSCRFCYDLYVFYCWHIFFLELLWVRPHCMHSIEMRWQ